MMEIVFATGNENKVKEVNDLIGNSYKIISLKDLGFEGELPETHETLEENAIEKAEFINNKYNIDCFAEDTGLEVESLNGEPGVYSARYAGENKSHEDNILLLLKNMAGVTNRRARFRTVIALITNDITHLFEGIVNGTITLEKKGSGGFGYDPIFKPEDSDITFAEMSLKDKGKISHRARAVEQLIHYLENI